MSCMVMNPEPLAALTDGICTTLNRSYEFLGFSAPEKLHVALLDCFDGYRHEEKQVYKRLYDLNRRAYAGRYREEIDDPDYCPEVDLDAYTLHKAPVFHATKNGQRHAPQPWHYQFLKLLDFYTYQTGEDATRDDDLHKSLRELCDEIAGFIARHSLEYDNAAEWGKI